MATVKSRNLTDVRMLTVAGMVGWGGGDSQDSEVCGLLCGVGDGLTVV